jgi:hypothetical protein
MELVEYMIDDIDIELLKDPTSTFIDNSAGCGNFLVGMKNRLLQYHTTHPREYVVCRRNDGR